MHIPEGALVSGSGDIAIRAMVTGKFQYPEGTEPVSAIYGIFTSAIFAEPVTVEIQHCVALKKEEDCCFLNFAVAHDQPHLPLCFRKLEGGSFSPDCQYGVISLSSFCYMTILKDLFSNPLSPWLLTDNDPSTGSDSDESTTDVATHSPEQGGSQVIIFIVIIFRIVFAFTTGVSSSSQEQDITPQPTATCSDEQVLSQEDTAEPIGASQPGKMWVWRVSPVLYCTVLYCTVLYCTVLYCTVVFLLQVPNYL